MSTPMDIESTLPRQRTGVLARTGTGILAMLQVLGDAELRARMHSAGPARASGYDWRIVAQRYLDLLIALARR